MVRLDVASLPAVAENLSGIGNAVAPGFADSVAMLTVIFSMTPPALLMDVTKPFSILFYESRTAPAVCFVAYARPNVRLSEKSDLKIGSLKMEAEPFQKDHLLIKTPNLPGIHPPLFLPAETSARRIENRGGSPAPETTVQFKVPGFGKGKKNSGGNG